MKKFILAFFYSLLFISLAACNNQRQNLQTSELTSATPSETTCEHKWIGAECSGEQTCGICGETKKSYKNHEFSLPNCQKPAICAQCGIEGGYGRHNFRNGTCVQPSICSICGASGDLEDHSYSLTDDPEIEICTYCSDRKRADTCDFFSNELRQSQYKEFIKSHKYTELRDYVQQYIDDCPPLETDNAYEILSIIEYYSPTLDNCIMQYDEFDEDYTISYRNAEKITRSVNVVPTVCESDLTVHVGFIASDWLFFDKLYIKFSSDHTESHSYESYDIERDVLSGGNIREYVTLYVGEYDLEDYETAEKITIRFENSETGEVIDHQMTDAEKDGVVALLKLKISYSKLSNLLYQYKRDHST